MARTIVSEENEATRSDMADASTELARNLRDAAKRLEHDPKASSLADHLMNLGALFERLCLEATEGVQPIDDVSLRSVSRVYQQIAIKLLELVELVADLEQLANEPQRPLAFAAAMSHAAMKVAKISELSEHATRLLNLRLS